MEHVDNQNGLILRQIISNNSEESWGNTSEREHLVHTTQHNEKAWSCRQLGKEDAGRQPGTKRRGRGNIDDRECPVIRQGILEPSVALKVLVLGRGCRVKKVATSVYQNIT